MLTTRCSWTKTGSKLFNMQLLPDIIIKQELRGRKNRWKLPTVRSSQVRWYWKCKYYLLNFVSVLFNGVIWITPAPLTPMLIKMRRCFQFVIASNGRKKKRKNNQPTSTDFTYILIFRWKTLRMLLTSISINTCVRNSINCFIFAVKCRSQY